MRLIECKTVCGDANIVINVDLITCVIDEGENGTKVYFAGSNNSALITMSYKNFVNLIK